MSAALVVMVYDVADDGRRRKLHALLRQYGVAAQESAFEARLTQKERERVLLRVEALLDPKQDRFVLYQVPRSHEGHIATLGLPRPELPERSFFIV